MSYTFATVPESEAIPRFAGERAGYGCAPEARNHRAFCFYCGCQRIEDLSFCEICGHNLLVENTVQPSLQGFKRKLAYDPLYASSFRISRKTFAVHRLTRRLAWQVAFVMMTIIPYYAVCKITLGEAFPRDVIESCAKMDLAMEHVVSGLFSVGR